MSVAVILQQFHGNVDFVESLGQYCMENMAAVPALRSGHVVHKVFVCESGSSICVHLSMLWIKSREMALTDDSVCSQFCSGDIE